MQVLRGKLLDCIEGDAPLGAVVVDARGVLLATRSIRGWVLEPAALRPAYAIAPANQRPKGVEES